MCQRDVAIEAEPRNRLVAVGPLDAISATRAAWLSIARIADEQDLRSLIKQKQAHCTIETGNDARSDTDLDPARLHQKRRGIQWRTIRRRLLDRHAARVDAVKALTRVEEELGLCKRPQHDTELRASDGCVGVAGIHRRHKRIDIRIVEIATITQRRAEPVHPVHRVLDIDSDTRFLHLVVASPRQKLPLIRIGQRQTNVVIAALKTDFGLHRQTGEGAIECVRSADAAEHPVVVLMKLIALIRVIQKIREIKVQNKQTKKNKKTNQQNTKHNTTRPPPKKRKP